MKILLDTLPWLWMQAAPDRLSEAARAALEDADNVLLLSPVSAWEIASKVAAGRLRLPLPAEEYVPSRRKSSGVDALPLQHSHALQVARLPMHHDDPFDRLLVAQAQVEDLPVLTHERRLADYDVRLLWAD